MQKNDLALARHVAKAHSISDSEDSDSATSPKNTSNMNSSLDLFGDSEDEGTLSVCQIGFLEAIEAGPD